MITDPQAGPILRRTRPDMTVVDTAEEAITDAELTLLLTEWDDFKNLDPHTTKTLPRKATIIDGRNCLDPTLWTNAGWQYHGMGRP